MTKQQALAQLELNAMALAAAQPGFMGLDIDTFRRANARLAWSQLDAAAAGATSYEISMASQWNNEEI